MNKYVEITSKVVIITGHYDGRDFEGDVALVTSQNNDMLLCYFYDRKDLNEAYSYSSMSSQRLVRDGANRNSPSWWLIPPHVVDIEEIESKEVDLYE